MLRATLIIMTQTMAFHLFIIFAVYGLYYLWTFEETLPTRPTHLCNILQSNACPWLNLNLLLHGLSFSCYNKPHLVWYFPTHLSVILNHYLNLAVGVTWVAAAVLLWSNTIGVTCGLKEMEQSTHSFWWFGGCWCIWLYSLCTKSNILEKINKQINDTEQKPSLGRLSPYTSTRRILLLKIYPALF